MTIRDKGTPYSQASLDNIYSEIIALSSSVGECRSAVESTHDAIDRLTNDVKEGHKEVLKKLSFLESKELERQGRYIFLWGLLQLSPSNIIKWSATILMVLALFMAKANFNVKGFVQHFYEVMMQ